MNKTKNKNTKKILDMYVKYNFPKEIEEEVIDWLNSDFHSQEKEEALFEIWNQIPQSHHINEKKALERIKKSLDIPFAAEQVIRRPWIFKVAAVLIPVFFASILLYIFNRPVDKIEIPMQMVELEIEDIIIKTEELKRFALLTDETELWVNSNSEFIYSQDRKTKLIGEAYFNVSKKDGKEFSVDLDFMKVTVTGTIFNIHSYSWSQLALVSLYEGNLRIETQDTLVNLTAGHELSYNKETNEVSVYSIMRDKPDWLRDIINFEDKTIKEIIEHLEEIYGVSINLDDKSILNEKMDLKFEGKIGLDEVLFFLTSINGELNYKKDDSTVFLYRLVDNE